MRVTLAFGCMVAAASCATAPPRLPFTGVLPEKISVDMAGEFTISPNGTLVLALARPCSQAVYGAFQCTHTSLDLIKVVAHTPWNQDLIGTWRDASHLEFEVDWRATAIDPLADNAAQMAARPWLISGGQWTPTPTEVAAILEFIGNATDTEVEVIRGGPAPKLEVSSSIADDVLHTGDQSTLIVRIANHGAGAAYRVVVTTRSSIEALHGLRLSFGAIDPGAYKDRTLRVTVPTSETAPDTLLVLTVSEANGFMPDNVSRRMSIKPSIVAPLLGVQCTIPGRSTAKLEFNAGQQLSLRCAVGNKGTAIAQSVDLDVSISGTALFHSAPRAIAAAEHAMFDAPITIPRDAPVGSTIEIAIAARDQPSSRSARTVLSGVVRKQRLCTPGQLTREQYRKRIEDLRKAKDAGALSQPEFDGYDAELLACLPAMSGQPAVQSPSPAPPLGSPTMTPRN